jgi:hypothetical protein
VKPLVIALFGLGLALAAGSARAETFLIQSGEDSSPYAFTSAKARGFLSTAYAFTNAQDGQDHSFEYYIRFNLPPELFEPGVTVESAYAWVYYGYDYTLFGDTTDEFGEVMCRVVLAPWSQATLTWNNRPPVSDVFDGWEDVTEKGLYWCDVTDLVAQWIAGERPNVGIAITSSQPRVIGFYTFDDGSVSPNYKPTLLVETLPETSSAAGLAAGAAMLGALTRARRARRSTSRHTERNSR